jgi:hypothetical protein
MLTIIHRKSGDRVNELLISSPLAQAGADGDTLWVRERRRVPISCTRPFGSDELVARGDLAGARVLLRRAAEVHKRSLEPGTRRRKSRLG